MDASCEVLKPIEYHFDLKLETEANEIDTPETVSQILKYNAALKELCK